MRYLIRFRLPHRFDFDQRIRLRNRRTILQDGNRLQQKLSKERRELFPLRHQRLALFQPLQPDSGLQVKRFHRQSRCCMLWLLLLLLLLFVSFFRFCLCYCSNVGRGTNEATTEAAIWKWQNGPFFHFVESFLSKANRTLLRNELIIPNQSVNQYIYPINPFIIIQHLSFNRSIT